MKPIFRAACSTACLSLLVTAAASAAEGPFDGRWSVVLDCADTTAADRNGYAKGYQFTFPVTITEGVLNGSYGVPGRPSSVVYTGKVGADGTLDIEATGATGRSDFAVGRPPRGTSYAYTLHGQLSGSTGVATRREVRPCTATFERQ